MRFQKSLIRVKISNESPVVTLPDGIFNDITDGQTLVATKKRDFESITLHVIKDKLSKIYEVFCEIKMDNTILHFISELKEIIDSVEGVVMLNIIDGICKGNKDTPCTFDGFLGIIEGCAEDDITGIREKIQNIELDGDKIVSSVTIEEVK
jgi:hypothetical protein